MLSSPSNPEDKLHTEAVTLAKYLWGKPAQEWALIATSLKPTSLNQTETDS